MIEVRVTVQVAGERLRTEWEALPPDPRAAGGDAPFDVVRDDHLAALSRGIEAGALLSARFEGGRRRVSGRHVQWVDVEVRKR